MLLAKTSVTCVTASGSLGTEQNVLCLPQEIGYEIGYEIASRVKVD